MISGCSEDLAHSRKWRKIASSLSILLGPSLTVREHTTPQVARSIAGIWQLMLPTSGLGRSHESGGHQSAAIAAFVSMVVADGREFTDKGGRKLKRVRPSVSPYRSSYAPSAFPFRRRCFGKIKMFWGPEGSLENLEYSLQDQ